MTTVHLSPRALGGVVLAIAFLAGVAVGVAAVKVSSRSDTAATLKTSNMAVVLDELMLDSAQRVSADSIVQRSAPRTEAVMIEFAGRLASVADSVDAQLRAILTPQQRRRLDGLRRKPVFLLKHRSKAGSETVDTLRPLSPAPR